MPQLSGGHLVTAITVVSACGFFLMGYDNGTSNVKPSSRSQVLCPISLTFPSSLSNIILQLEKLEVLLLSLLLERTHLFVLKLIDSGIGAFVSMFFVEEIGRTRSIQLGACVMMLGTILMASSFSVNQLIAGRLVAGLGLGVNTSAIPAWHSECSPKRKRGALITVDFVLVNFGLFFAYWFEYGLNLHTTGAFKFRFPMAFQIIFELFIFIACFFLPESPRWLAVHGKRTKSLEVLARLHGKGATIDDHVILSQYESIMQSAELEGAMDSNNFAALFTMGQTQNFKRLVMGAAVQFMNPWTG
jgi:MFS family permease